MRQIHVLKLLAAAILIFGTCVFGTEARADSLTVPIRIATSTASDGPTLGIPRWKAYMLETDPNQLWICYANGKRTLSNISYTIDGGRTWSTNAIQIYPSGYLDMHCSVFGRNGILYATWPGLQNTMFRRFAAPIHSNSDAGPVISIAGTTSLNRSSIMVQNTGRIWLFTRRSYASASENVLYNYSDNNGSTWSHGTAYATNSTSTRIGSMPYVGGNPALVVLYLDGSQGFEYYLWNGTSFVARPDHSIYAVNMGQERVFTHNQIRDSVFHLIFGVGDELHHVWKNYNGGTGTWHHRIIDSCANNNTANLWFPTSTVRGDELYLFYCKRLTTSSASSLVYYKKWSQITQTWTEPLLVSTGVTNVSTRDPNGPFKVPDKSPYIPVVWRSGTGPFDVNFAKVVVALDTIAPPVLYNLTMASFPIIGGTIDPRAGSAFYPEGTRVNLAASASTNYAFASWTGGVENPASPSTDIVMNGNKSVTANFTVTSGPAGSISGLVSINSVGLNGVSVNLLDSIGDLVITVVTDIDGNYSIPALPPGSYIVDLNVPLGFGPVGPSSVPVILAGAGLQANFSLREAPAGSVADYWWWKSQFQAIRSGTPLYLGITRADVDRYCASIFNHFYDRTDEFALRIPGVTCMATPVRALTFDDVARVYLDIVDESNAAKTRKHLLICLLNVASARLSQRATVSVDGSTASQAITYYGDLYFFAASTNWSLWYNLNRISTRVMIAAGVIPLSTANVMYKPEDSDSGHPMPSEFTLSQNYPNPFNPATTITYALPDGAYVLIQIFNVLGQSVRTLVDNEQTAGSYQAIWDGTDNTGRALGSGVYLYRITAGSFSQTRKMLLLK